MTIQSGWMEHRKHERVAAALKISYRVLGEEEKRGALGHSAYSQTTADKLPALAQKFHSYHAVTRDLSEGGMSLTGEHPFAQGEHVEVSIQLPQSSVPVKVLAMVVRSSSFFQLGKTLHSAGVKILALNREDMDRYTRYLLAEKLRRESRG